MGGTALIPHALDSPSERPRLRDSGDMEPPQRELACCSQAEPREEADEEKSTVRSIPLKGSQEEAEASIGEVSSIKKSNEARVEKEDSEDMLGDSSKGMCGCEPKVKF